MVCRGTSLHTAVYRVQRTIKLHRLVWGDLSGGGGVYLSMEATHTVSVRGGGTARSLLATALQQPADCDGDKFFSDEMAVCLAGL